MNQYCLSEPLTVALNLLRLPGRCRPLGLIRKGLAGAIDVSCTVVFCAARCFSSINGTTINGA